MSSENPQSIFQLTPSRRATVTWVPILCSQIFQLTPSRRATREPVCHIQAEEFQLTPSRRATFTGSVLITSVPFQLTPSRRATFFSFKERKIKRYFNSRPHGGRPGSPCQRQASRTFQLTPSRRATNVPSPISIYNEISTHALTEGDCKFRQIFLLNRGYAYSISLYFLPHFISLLPQILSFQQKPFKFQVRIFLLFSVHLAFALQNQCVHHVKSRFCTNMFYFVFVLFTQIVKSQTISLFIYDFF